MTKSEKDKARFVAMCDLIGAVQTIRAVEAARVAGTTKPVAAGMARSNALRIAVSALARFFRVQLKPIHDIDARGDLSIASAGKNSWDIAGAPFTAEFCDALNTYCKPRCGAPGTVAHLDPNHANWCHINHFDAERMVCALSDVIEAESKKV